MKRIVMLVTALLNRMVLLAQIGVPILALVGISCLIRCKGKDRQRLVWTAVVFLGALVLWGGGGVLLGFFHMTWRNAPAAAICGVLLVSGWVGIILTLVCFLPMELPSMPEAMRWAAKASVTFFAAVVLLVTLWAGPLGIAFAFDNKEQKIEYQGQTLLEVDDGFLDPHYSYYVYHGPLVRGKERVYDEYEPLIHS